ncbi:hypothetical protein EDB83DRAFT_2643330 [Lactarius deliciosus]|nr:hypothetical protein EDB83DRAFT_2643330 [Lactarius deliciosus]
MATRAFVFRDELSKPFKLSTVVKTDISFITFLFNHQSRTPLTTAEKENPHPSTGAYSGVIPGSQILNQWSVRAASLLPSCTFPQPSRSRGTQKHKTASTSTSKGSEVTEEFQNSLRLRGLLSSQSKQWTWSLSSRGTAVDKSHLHEVKSWREGDLATADTAARTALIPHTPPPLRYQSRVRFPWAGGGESLAIGGPAQWNWAGVYTCSFTKKTQASTSTVLFALARRMAFFGGATRKQVNYGPEQMKDVHQVKVFHLKVRLE